MIEIEKEYKKMKRFVIIAILVTIIWAIIMILLVLVGD